jgi:thioester reductase-like protein
LVEQLDGPAFVFHAAADVRHVAPRNEVFRANETSTANVLRLARRFGAEVHHVSSIGIKGVWSNGNPPTLSEADLFIGQTFTEAYSESKAEAERLVGKFRGKGGVASVYRASTVAPHAASGRFQRNIADHFFSRFLRAVVTTGIATDWPGRSFSLIPADVMASMIVALADRGQRDATYHLVSPFPINHSRIVAMLQNCGYAIRVTDETSFRRIVLSHNTDPSWQDAVGAFLNLLDTTRCHVPIDARWTDAWLDHVQVAHFMPSALWFERFLDHCIRENFLPEPRHWRSREALQG